ncbi:acyl--CoA ligase [Amycolatopsis sp. FU40]|uniref:class I adenylate-forming enzyme family protein n=1 Tax=Amycolatopsis sp. FU40 TaxID=2914159 RepID=UPI001F29F6B6|nr:class I adenylate-forming enzyme family protein [Amycolatopsis sp. FU40]UKD58827.1 acyl--CoA ligase [Amycolatopsis sp. FU40]
MSLSADPRQALTAPGGPCELRTEEVLGVPMTVFARRARSLGEVLAASARHGEREYLVTADRRINFADHARQVASVACALRDEYGIGKGDRVAIAAANSPEWVIAFWATVSLGAIAVGYNAWWSRPELAYALGHTRPSLVVADSKRAALLDGVPVLTVEEDVPRLARSRPDAPLPSCAVAEDDPAVILYTSGTTGRPKGAVHTHRNLTSVIEFHRLNSEVARVLGDPTDPSARRYLLGVPLFHIAGLHNLVVPRLADGSAVVVHQGGFDAERVLRLVEAERVTNWGVVPTMAHRLLEHGNLARYDLSSLTAFTLGAAPSSPAFQQRLRAELPMAEKGLVDSYGLTESSTAIAVAAAGDLAAFPGTVGHPIATVELEIRDTSGEAMPEGSAGEICVRSPFTMLGYWEDPEATAAAIDDERWLHTGDIGVLSDGLLRLAARRSDLILHGGENVYPAEVENVLAEHPAVRECIVLGVPHVDLGQEVAAVVVVSVPIEAEELRAFAAERLAYFKVPSRWRIGPDPLPRNVTGKVVRSKVPRP